jgi:hypothetical protein
VLCSSRLRHFQVSGCWILKDHREFAVNKLCKAVQQTVNIFLHRPNKSFYFACDEGAIAEINNRRENIECSNMTEL